MSQDKDIQRGKSVELLEIACLTKLSHLNPDRTRSVNNPALFMSYS
jgi:hypothetical protein